MKVLIHDSYEALSKWVAYYLASKINAHDPASGRPFVMGLPTGTSPLGTYQQLVSLHKAGEVSFQNVATFNMAAFVGLRHNQVQSTYHYMWNNLFNYIDIPHENVNLLDGCAKDPDAECRRYEDCIARLGGIDLFFGGVGPDGDIGFNEPGSSLASRTRIKTLTEDTRIANASLFGGEPAHVPKTAMTVGVKTIMDAREVVIILSGRRKAKALQKVVEEGVNHFWTVSMLQLHEHVTVVCDDAATAELKVGTVNYFKGMEKDHLALPEL